MASPETMQLLTMVLFTLAAGVGVYAVVTMLLPSDGDVEKRVAGVTEARSRKTARIVQAEQVATRRKAVADTLKELENKQSTKVKVTLRHRLEQAGLDVTVRAFWVASGVAGLVMMLLLWLAVPGISPIAYIAAGFVGTFGLPRWVVSRMIRRRQNKFLGEFANAIDVIVRGVKSGLPLNECLGIIARESPSPIREEFREIVEQQRVGVTMQDAFERMIARLPLPEVKFFAIVVGIQQQAGGNLSEALGNLSGVLRDRRAMAAKVQALSGEAKASAYVLGSLPFCVTTLVWLSSPAYISLLWTTKTGIFLVMCGGLWMLTGIMMMKKMINFKY